MNSSEQDDFVIIENTDKSSQNGLPLLDYLLHNDNFEIHSLDLENWKILKLIGQGAYAKVFLVQHHSET